MKKTITLSLFSLFSVLGMAQVPTNGLISSYTFNQGNADDETNNNDGTVTGATLTSDRFGNDSKAYSLDGIDDLIDFGDIAAFQMGNNDFSISFWMYYNIDQLAQVIGKRQNSNPYDQYGVLIGNVTGIPVVGADVSTFLRTDGLNRIVNAGDLKGNWHHVVLTHDYDGVSSMYVDNNLINSSSTTFTGTLDALGASLVVGLFDYSTGYYYNGKIDDIYIYNQILTLNDIEDLYTDPNPTLGISETNFQNLNVFPNPAKEIISVALETEESVIVYDISGYVLCMSPAKFIHEIDISAFSKGIYLLKTDSGQTVKFIKE
jgi:hypothetical protein